MGAVWRQFPRQPGDLWHARKHCVRNLGGPAPGLAHEGQVCTGNPRGTTVMDGCRESDRFLVPRKPSNTGRPEGPAEEVEGRERAKGNVVQHTRGRTQRRVLPVTGAQPRTAGTFGCLRVITQGRSPVRSCRTPGSVRGVSGNRHPYRDHCCLSGCSNRPKQTIAAPFKFQLTLSAT
jgi:hypothetical protein